MHPRIGDFYVLCENAIFESIDTGKSFVAADEMSDAKQGAWGDGPHSYDDDSLIIVTDALGVGEFAAPIFKNTNEPVTHVFWHNPKGEWFRANVKDLLPL